MESVVSIKSMVIVVIRKNQRKVKDNYLKILKTIYLGIMFIMISTAVSIKA